jgi:hypothetical protein
MDGRQNVVEPRAHNANHEDIDKQRPKVASHHPAQQQPEELNIRLPMMQRDKLTIRFDKHNDDHELQAPATND